VLVGGTFLLIKTKQARLENRETRDLSISPGTVEEGTWFPIWVKADDGRTPEYIFLHFGCLSINNQNYSEWYTLYRLPSNCEWVYMSPQRMQTTDNPAAKALAIYPEKESTSQSIAHNQGPR
jgi:hypothetical protein